MLPNFILGNGYGHLQLPGLPLIRVKLLCESNAITIADVPIHGALYSLSLWMSIPSAIKEECRQVNNIESFKNEIRLIGTHGPARPGTL